jgi:CRISPR/Cas system CMR subunit Cmr6 (Cas7 group RAMP superfamily)
MPDPVRAAGPLGQVLALSDGSLQRLGDGANSLVMLNRVAFFDSRAGKLADEGKRALLGWAVAAKLGQDEQLIAAVGQRREAMLRALSAGSPVRLAVRLIATTEWRLAVGLGNKANAHEIGLALHGTYGWPVIPGSALKGLAAAWAVASGEEPAVVRRVFGAPRTDVPPVPADSDEPRAARGSVCFMDAIPAAQPVGVFPDVLTPHVKPYYDNVASGRPVVVPPAEYHNPVPLTFLTVRGAFAVDLYGPAGSDLDLAAGWLKKAGDELGAGGKTAAGYGYLTVEEATA